MALPEDDVEEVDPEPALARILDHEHDALVVGPGLRPGLATADLSGACILTVPRRPPAARRARRRGPADAGRRGRMVDGGHAPLRADAARRASSPRLRTASEHDPGDDGDLNRRRRGHGPRRRPRRPPSGARSWCSRARTTVIAAPDGSVSIAPFENPAMASRRHRRRPGGDDRRAARPGHGAVRRGAPGRLSPRPGRGRGPRADRRRRAPGVGPARGPAAGRRGWPRSPGGSGPAAGWGLARATGPPGCESPRRRCARRASGRGTAPRVPRARRQGPRRRGRRPGPEAPVRPRRTARERRTPAAVDVDPATTDRGRGCARPASPRCRGPRGWRSTWTRSGATSPRCGRSSDRACASSPSSRRTRTATVRSPSPWPSRRQGADGLSVAALDEAYELREAGVTLPLLVIYPVPPEHAAAAARAGIAVSIGAGRLLERVRERDGAGGRGGPEGAAPRGPRRDRDGSRAGRRAADEAAVIRSDACWHPPASGSAASGPTWRRRTSPPTRWPRTSCSDAPWTGCRAPCSSGPNRRRSGATWRGAAASSAATWPAGTPSGPGLSIYGLVPDALTPPASTARSAARLRPVMALKARPCGSPTCRRTTASRTARRT